VPDGTRRRLARPSRCEAKCNTGEALEDVDLNRGVGFFPAVPAIAGRRSTDHCAGFPSHSGVREVIVRSMSERGMCAALFSMMRI